MNKIQNQPKKLHFSMIWPLVFLLVFGVDNVDCSQNLLDLAFIVDASGSVGSSDFSKQLTFLQNVVLMADVDSGKVRIGVVVFSDNARVEFHLNSYSTSTGVRDAIGSISYDNGLTNTAAALQMTRTDIFKTENGDRSNVDNVAVLVTDGDNWTSDPYSDATALKNHNVRVIVVAIQVAISSFGNIASSPTADNTIHVNTFAELNSFESSVILSIFTLADLCQRVARQAAGNSCFHFSFELSVMGRDFLNVATILLEELNGKDRSECAELCIRHAECLSFVLRDDGRCQLLDAVCDETAITEVATSNVYVLQQAYN